MKDLSRFIYEISVDLC